MTRGYLLHKGAEIPQPRKTLFTNPVNSEITINREREKNITELVCFLSHPTPLFIAF
jgi:hypothetical protein